MSRSAFVTFIEVEQHDVHLSQLRNVLQLDWCQAFASSSRNAQILAQPNTYLYFGNGLLSFALRKTKLQTIPAGEDIHVIIYCNFYCLCKWWKHILRISGNWIKVIGGQRSWGTRVQYFYHSRHLRPPPPHFEHVSYIWGNNSLRTRTAVRRPTWILMAAGP